MAVTLLGCILWAAFFCIVILAARQKRRKYPPGPKGFPIIGNIFDIPKDHPWLAYEEWGRQSGSDIVHLRLLGTHVVVLNTETVAKELFERRSPIYSGRPITVMVHELLGWWRNLGLMEYGDVWRAHRRMFHQQFRQQTVHIYHPTIQNGVGVLLRLLLDSPDLFAQHIRFASGATILEIMYGIDAQTNGRDRIIELVEKAVHFLSISATAGAYLVDTLPILKHLPKWFPGAEFKRQTAEWKPLVDEMFFRPFEEVKAAFKDGRGKPCVTSRILARPSQEGDDEKFEETILNVAGTAYAAGVDTTVTTLNTFVLAMLLHPDTQRAAQDELDHVVGQNRLPTLEDRALLPYVTALTKEVLRWHPALPLGVWHKSSADDIYNGFDIPAGSFVIGNAWAMLHDEKRYSNPSAFNPARFLAQDGQLNADVPDPTEAFGYGRRICPGRHFALDVGWLTMANILAAFSLEKPLDEDGNVVEPSGEYTTGLFSAPKPFKASFKPRFPGAVSLIRSPIPSS